MTQRSENIIAAVSIALVLGGVVGFVGMKVYKQLVFEAENTYIMLRKNSLERIIRNPCMAGTIEYMGNNYILCRRRPDYEPRESRYWPSPYPEKS